MNKVESPFEVQKFVREVETGDYDSFFHRLQSFFADTTYEVIREQELHYENVLFIVFKLVGFYTKVEYHTNNGRVDLFLQTDKFIYIMEFKLNGTIDKEEQVKEYIGGDRSKPVPKYYYMALLFKKGDSFKAIAFWMEHTDSKPSKTIKLVDYALSIDELEEKTGIDFFPNLNDNLENALEATYSTKAWPGLE